MTDLPEPLTPPDCDLRAFLDMPFAFGRFRDSDLVTIESPEAVLAAIHLWGAAWHQVPAASLPNDDRVLAKLAGYGRAVEAWLAVRSGALRGFVLCRDGRLYHDVLSEKANEAWDKRLHYNWEKAKDRHRKAQKDLPEDDRTEFPSFEDWKAAREAAHAVPKSAPEIPAETDPVSGGTSSVRARAPSAPARTGARSVPEPKSSNSSGNDEQFRRNDPEIPADLTHKGREGKGIYSTLPNSSVSDSRSETEKPLGRDGVGNETSPLRDADLVALYEAVREASGYNPVSPGQIDRTYRVIEDWRREGIDFDRVVIPTIRSVVAATREPTRTLGRFSAAVRHEHARLKALGGSTYAAPPSPILEPDGESPALRPLREDILKRIGPARYCQLANDVRFEIVPKDDRLPLRVKGTEFAVSRFCDEFREGPLLKLIKSHGFKELWNG